MDHSIFVVLGAVLPRAGPQIPVLVPVALEVAVHSCCQRVGPDVELAIFVQEGLFDVLLDNVRSFLAVYLGIINDALNMVQVSADLDPSASVCVLTWLDDPHRVAIPGILCKLRLRPGVLVNFDEFLEFSIVFAFLDVESEGHVVKWIEPLRLVKYLHIVEYGLLVAQMEVVLLVVRGHQMVVGMVLFLFIFLFLFLGALP